MFAVPQLLHTVCSTVEQMRLVNATPCTRCHPLVDAVQAGRNPGMIALLMSRLLSVSLDIGDVGNEDIS